jgi:hypothetical protein
MGIGVSTLLDEFDPHHTTRLSIEKLKSFWLSYELQNSSIISSNLCLICTYFIFMKFWLPLQNISTKCFQDFCFLLPPFQIV